MAQRNLIHLRPEFVARIRGRGGNGHDESLGPLSSQGSHRGAHRRTRRETVINQDHRETLHVKTRTVPAIRLFPSDEFPLFPGDGLDGAFGDADLRSTSSFMTRTPPEAIAPMASSS